MIQQPIFLTGTSGIGKTTLAQYISQRYRIPFINGSSSVLWEKYNLKSHNEVLQMGVNDPQMGLQFQIDLLNLREKMIQESPSEGFVTDRSVVDNLVYFMFQNAPYLSDHDIHRYIHRCINSFDRIVGTGKYKLIYLTRDFYENDKMPKIEDDSKRITSEYYQNMMSALFDHVIDKNMLEFKHTPERYLKMRSYNWDARIALTDSFLNKEPNMFDNIYNNWILK